ncbi:MAG: Sodium, potassium, lithium and rubidium/H(+) antiporter [Candidatus Accumulibacter regalis]|jgi:Na+/H+ antiporter|uniref:Sodium, potassium, lithium and rubidium/H(+) antiporter n=1 Tax=Accumulibacter regalis TaxID=522306 RepID=A0A011NY30_ACCRE|nr:MULTISPECIES: Na+/H+ antiporter [unclassified Candidatus Accumulibacter]EXI87598.1 MAG: Sodium, potassium, lithium and rubidium/H(+) antiporter [Candidatus Accumulibacter regalis]MQM35461.1 Na+/H+ antiporter [Candidatus Accumulibacter phosphatis]MBN8512834.1 Na+/H+ antiporter [Accumulibacter sp.]MBO3703826.1 Na+/H+ antiporter [Accumulibacter sp.]HRE69626.1 Na+/H+ antiporter [Accumulibacter sp.]
MPLIELSLLLLLAIAVGGALVHWTPLPLPILLVVVGVVASFLPGLGSVEVDPELFLLLFIPPILFADAWVLPRRDFVHTLKPVLLLALGLVVLTVVVVGYAMHWLIPAMPLAVAFTLGAIVSPTDAVATVATTQLLPLPARIVHIVNAESLLNDASGLVAFKLAVAAAATGLFSSTAVAGNFVHLAGGGIIIGIAVEWVGRELRQRLIRLHAGDPVLQTLLTILIPYGAYLAAEALHVSGILAVVAAGLWASGQEVKGLTADARQHAREVWRMLSYVLNGAVFVLLGLQLRRMLSGVDDFAPLDLVLYALVLWALLMVLRIAWVWTSAHLRFRLRWGWTGSTTGPDPKRLLLVSWAAVRGSITLATALSVPAVVAAGTPFPERDLVVFLAAATIILTLAFNGVPLPWLIRKLALNSDEDSPNEERTARAEIARAALAAVADVASDLTDREDIAFVEQLLSRYRGKLELHEGDPGHASLRATHIALRRRLRLAAIAAERQRLRQLRETNVINDETQRIIEAELDERELVSMISVDRG